MLRNREPDIELDLLGEVCPYPLVILKKEAGALKPGEMLKALVDSKPSVAATIPRFCQKNGFELNIVEVVPEEQWEVYMLRK